MILRNLSSQKMYSMKDFAAKTIRVLQLQTPCSPSLPSRSVNITGQYGMQMTINAKLYEA